CARDDYESFAYW
nr:immunoglobulin heavy chain junction region [Mus musculus]